MAKLKLLSTIFSKLSTLGKNDGQVIVSKDSKSLYVDLDGERIEVTDWIDVDTEQALLAILSPLTNKYYYTKDTNKIWKYINSEWKNLNKDNVIETIKVNGTTITPESKTIDINIPTVGNGTITITQNGTTKGTFTTNQSGNTTVELTDTDTNTDTKVTSVGNHYTPSGGTTTSASGGTLTDITNSSSGVQVVTGVTKDAAGHVTGVTSVALKSTNTNTTYGNMTGATSSAAGSAGLVPAPAAGKQASFLRGDGTWAVPTDTNTWRGIQNNLTSDSTTDSLSAAQGKALKTLVDGKAALSHTHNSVNDISNSSITTFAYSKAGLGYSDYTWLAGWNGYELRAVNKNQFASSSHTHNYLPLAGGTLTGGVVMSTENKKCIEFRPNNAAYYTHLSYQTSGNEALVLGFKNSVTSFMIAHNEDPANIATDRWTKIIPSLQVKGNCVAINKLIANGKTPSYTLDVNGTGNFSGSVTASTINVSGVFSQNRTSGSTVGENSFVGNNNNTASGTSSTAFGGQTKATGGWSFAEGWNTTSSGTASHAEGWDSVASNDCAHAEGKSNTASGFAAHAEGEVSVASGTYSHAEGHFSTASGESSHSEGNNCTAKGIYSHAGGNGATGGGYASLSQGWCTSTSSDTTIALGRHNKNTSGNLLELGYGSDSVKKNVFSITSSGYVKATGTYTASTTADYAEYFEWLDGNPNGEDRVGYFVTLEGNKIRLATKDDAYILGIVSGEPFVLGNGDCDIWNGIYLRDEFRRKVMEDAPKLEVYTVIDEETGEELTDIRESETEFEGYRPKLNPEYDSTKEYIPRSERPEWAPVGMLGVLAVRHDGTAKVNGYVTVNKDGIATACYSTVKNSYRVIKENSETVVEIIFR